MGNRCEAGRDRDGIEAVEYCDKRFLETSDIGLGSMDRALPELKVDVIRGGRTGWFGFVEEAEGGDDDGDGDGDGDGDWNVVVTGAGEDVADDELVAMAAVMLKEEERRGGGSPKVSSAYPKCLLHTYI